VDGRTELVVKALVAVAWADGCIHAREVEILQTLVTALALSSDDANALREYARSPRALDELPLVELPAQDRVALLRHAVLLTYADGKQTDDERGVLDGLVARLQIPVDEARSIIQAAARRAQRLSDLV